MKRLLLPLLLCGVILGSLPISTGAAASSPTAKYLCLIVLDAGRPDYITKNIKAMPNMKALLNRSRWYNRAWVGDLMSITPPGHAVIGTGSLPKNDGGIVNWDWGIHSTGKISPTLQAVENYQNGYAFKIMRQSGTPTLANVIHKKYPTGLVIAGSGSHFHAAGPMGGPDANWIYSYQRSNGNWAPFSLGTKKVPAKLLNDSSLRERLPADNNSTVPLLYDPLVVGHQDSLAMKFAVRSLQLYRPRAMMVNLPEIDTFGHWSRNWYPEETKLYRAFDQDLGQLVNAYKKAGIYNQTLFVVTADHGIIQSKHRVLDREAVVKQVKSMVGQSGTILTNGGGAAGPTMTSIWIKDPSQNERVAKAVFAKHYDNVSAIYYMTHVNGHYAYKQAGCESCSPELVKTYDYLVGTEAGPTGEDIAILLRENARNSGLSIMPGRHGGADWGSQHITLMFAGPGVVPGKSDHPARLADIAPTVERLLGISPNARDGVVLADAVKNPSGSEVSTQASSDAPLNTYVTALEQRAARDITLERKGLLANYIPSNEVIIHWKRRWAVTIAGAVVFVITAIGLAWAIAEVRREGTGLKWTA